MKKPNSKTDEKPMCEEYDFSDGTRGQYARRYAEGTNVVVLDPDIAELFPDSESVNDALRSLVDLARKQAASVKRKSRSSKKAD